MTLDAEIAEGQNIRCPYCDEKFSFTGNEYKKTVKISAFKNIFKRKKSAGDTVSIELKTLWALQDIKSSLSWVCFLLILITIGQIASCNKLDDICHKGYNVTTY